LPKKPTDSLQGFRIELQDSERELLQHFATSYRIKAVCGDNGVIDDFGDISKVLKLLGVIGGLLELFGITDVFDFDQPIKADILEAKDNFQANYEAGIEARGAGADALLWQRLNEAAARFRREGFGV
jgi:hypothetical protein